MSKENPHRLTKATIEEATEWFLKSVPPSKPFVLFRVPVPDPVAYWAELKPIARRAPETIKWILIELHDMFHAVCLTEEAF